MVDSDEPRYITATGIAQATTAITFTANAGRVYVAGTAIGSSIGASLNGNDQLVITATGQVSGLDSDGAEGIRAAGSGNRITVAGSVYARDGGIFALTGSNDTEINITATGTVVGGSNGYGSDSGGFSAAVASSGTGNVLVNDGVIIGEFNPDNGLRLAVLNASVADQEPTGSNLDLDATFSVFNSGSIHGDVLLGAGEDVYKAAGGGFVNGLIDLGDGDDIFSGGAADEVVEAGGGADNMLGGGGDDRLLGDGGNDFMRGGSGSDTLAGGADDDAIRGEDGEDVLNGNDGDDSLFGGNDEDRLNGGGGNDALRGDGGADRLIGGSGEDNLFGGAGCDRLVGGDDADRLEGEAGDDVLIGQDGSDRFFFGGNFGDDRISDFDDANSEKIILVDVDSISNFSDLANNHLSSVGGNAVIDDGAGNTITLMGFAAADLDAGDFLF
ncbi:calcium-binding protein [Acuticoccus sp. MNP-M23]|uniref:calcium-binding protein n=1 Tax=Acuticoccus sp. MNP-M23 TaxID=3072793 RepID=UPI00281582B0|nr:calcium-binding protein [Acuticoccus sp. MNP-M23]WMS42633.1 calcium-binding protein [Acuticoccus sp. MNP-M23]